NPAIVLTTGDVVIEAGGRILVRGDNVGGAPQSTGANGTFVAGGAGTSTPGSTGVAGGGGGGGAPYDINNATFGLNGEAGFGSPDQFLTPGSGGAANPVRIGQG